MKMIFIVMWLNYNLQLIQKIQIVPVSSLTVLLCKIYVKILK